MISLLITLYLNRAKKLRKRIKTFIMKNISNLI